MSIQYYRKALPFYLLSTIIPWALWGVAALLSHREASQGASSQLASLVAFTGLLVPVMVAVILSRGHPSLMSDMQRRFFNFNGIKPVYVLISFGLMLASILAAQGISLLFGYPSTQFRLIEEWSFSSGVFPVWFMLLASPFLEELAWHSYGTDSLRSRFNLITTCLIFALFWGVWHMPLSLIKDYYHSNLVEEGWIYSLNFLLSLFPFVIIMNWIYYKTNRNILLPIVFHITAGLFNETFQTHPMSKVIQTGLLIVISVIIIAREKSFFFQKSFSNLS